MTALHLVLPSRDAVTADGGTVHMRQVWFAGASGTTP